MVESVEKQVTSEDPCSENKEPIRIKVGFLLIARRITVGKQRHWAKTGNGNTPFKLKSFTEWGPENQSP